MEKESNQRHHHSIDSVSAQNYLQVVAQKQYKNKNSSKKIFAKLLNSLRIEGSRSSYRQRTQILNSQNVWRDQRRNMYVNSTGDICKQKLVNKMFSEVKVETDNVD